MRHLLLPTALALAIAACSEGEPPGASSDAAASAERGADRTDAAAQEEARRETATVGPLRYAYDPEVLERVEVRASLPPDYESERDGIKLIPAERAELLGKRECSYGESGMVTECNAEQEAGLEIVQLDGPLSRWRENFANSRMGTGPLESVELGGVSGFRFTAQAEGSGAEYTFLPAGDDAAVLVTRQFRFGQDAGEEEIERVIASLSLSR